MATDEGQGQDKVTGGDGEGHVGERRELGEVQCQLTTTEEEMAAVKRHLADSRRENDDLLKAVAYLRSRLDTTTTPIDDTPTKWHTNDNNAVTTVINAAAAATDDDDDGDDEKYDDSETLDQNSSAELSSYNGEYCQYCVYFLNRPKCISLLRKSRKGP